MPEPTKLLIEVTAGIIPGEVMPQHTRRWTLTADDISDRNLLTDISGSAMMYATALANPQHLNWVRHEWTWL